mgnify:FL=1
MSKLIILYKYICKCLMKIKSYFKRKDQLDYWDKLYDKYYEEYKFLSIKELRRLQSIKSVDYNVNMSYTWVNIFIGAILATFVSNIINVTNFISSDLPINLDQSMVDFIGCVVIVIVILAPLVGYFYFSIKRISTLKTRIFYFLFMAVFIIAQFAKKPSLENFVNNSIIVLLFLNILMVIVAFLDKRKQRLGIECAVIKDLLLEREDNKKNRT